MSMISTITSAKNPKVREVTEILSKSSARKKKNCFAVEGIKMFREIPEEDLLEVWVCDRFAGKHPKMISSLPAALPTYQVPDALFEKISDTTTPQGILALVRQKSCSLGELLSEGKFSSGPKEAPLFLLLENLQDPGNLGTILRSGEGAGVTAVILSSDSVDCTNPKVIRSTMGAIFRVPVLVTENLQETIALLKQSGIRVYAAHLDSESLPYDRADWSGPSAVLIGNESKGLSAAVTACADEKVHIPMLGQVESLNAAVAASLIAFEAARVRRNCYKM